MQLEKIIRVVKNKPTDIEKAVFRKEYKSNKNQISKLEELLTKVDGRTKSIIENDIKALKYGAIGENNIYFELKSSFIPMMCLHDIRLEYKDMVAQIDFIAITPKQIYVIECKNLIGDIQITDGGEFIRYKKNAYGKVVSKEGMYSPIVQNERHINVLKEFLADKLGYKHKLKRIESLVVTANPKTVINKKYASKELNDKIIRHDQLIDRINEVEKNKKIDWVFTEEDMVTVANLLARYHKEIEINYEAKYSIDVSRDNTSVIEKNDCADKSDDVLRIALKEYRLKKSKEENIKAYMVFSNDTMEEIIKIMPKSRDEILKIRGFGEVKCEKYGDDILMRIHI